VAIIMLSQWPTLSAWFSSAVRKWLRNRCWDLGNSNISVRKIYPKYPRASRPRKDWSRHWWVCDWFYLSARGY
jgi:hypothetical protein